MINNQQNWEEEREFERFESNLDYNNKDDGGRGLRLFIIPFILLIFVVCWILFFKNIEILSKTLKYMGAFSLFDKIQLICVTIFFGAVAIVSLIYVIILFWPGVEERFAKIEKEIENLKKGEAEVGFAGNFKNAEG